MTAADPKRQKDARSILDKIFTNASNVWVIHYSCESFYDAPDGRSPRVTSIALRDLADGQTVSFSIHKVAEIKEIPVSDIAEHYDCLEREMLRNFYSHLKKFQQRQYLHWNMRDSNFGFQAIEHRFRVLGGKDAELLAVDDRNKADLSRLLINIYGLGYIDHPRLEKLLEKNNITRLDFLTGKQEAEAFKDKEFVKLHLSTLRKVDVLANIAGRAHDRGLKTNTSWWDMHGGRVMWAYNWITEHPKWGFGGVVAAVLIAIIALVYQ